MDARLHLQPRVLDQLDDLFAAILIDAMTQQNVLTRFGEVGLRVFHLEEFVHFAGYQENIPEVMRAFDIFVMPSRQETFGLVAIEAMAMECPIVISSGGSAAEIVGE